MSRRARSVQLVEAERDRIADTLRLAERLGGEAVDPAGGGRNVADDIVAHAQHENTTQIVIGKSTRSRWFEMLHGSVVHDLLSARRQYQRPCHCRRGRRGGAGAAQGARAPGRQRRG